MSKKQQEGNHALCPSDFPDCPEDCKGCYDILSLSQGDCRACWEHYFDRTVKGWSERELKEQVITINCSDVLETIDNFVNKMNKMIADEPDNDALKELKMFVLEDVYKKRIMENPEKHAIDKLFGENKNK